MVESIVYILAFCYYLFCVIAMITYVQEDKAYSFLNGIFISLCCMIIAPIGIPIILGIEIGNRLKEENSYGKK